MVYYVQSSLFGLLILSIVYLEIRKSNIDLNLNQFLFRALIISTALLLIIEMVLNLINGLIFDNSRFWLSLVVMLFYILNPLPPALWVLFAEKWMDRRTKINKFVVYSVVGLYSVHVIASVISLFNGQMFIITNDSVYKRGQFYIFMVMLMIGYLIFASIRIFMKRKMLSKSEFITLLSFAFPALLGGMIQSLFFGVSILWKSVSVSILIIFIKLQNFDMYMDHLTGLWNRRKLQQFFDNFSHDTFKNQMMGGIMIDIDHFKMINDRHGHIVGDKVLSEVAQILKQTFNKEDFVCRYGGDEFVVILYIKNQNDLESCIVRLKKNLDKFNVMSQHPFDVNLSVGYDIVNLSLQTQSEIYLSSLDKKMYENKLRHRQSAQDHSVYF